MHEKNSIVAALFIGVCLFAGTASAWDAHGHRTITLLAMDGFAKNSTDMPEFLKSADVRAMVAYQASEPDRYRSIKSHYLAHENNPEHYIDIEDLEPFGLTLSTVPPLRYEYLRAMAIAKYVHPENAKPYNEKTDMARIGEWPGFLPHAIMEHHAKLIAAFRQIRVLDKLHDTSRAPQMEMAKADVYAEMGFLSHFVGDAAQPLHTTRHHHGWIGDNPHGYSTNKGIHAYIDGQVLTHHHLDHDSVAPFCTFDRKVDAIDPWQDVIAHIQRANDQVVPLYTMEKSGALKQEEGKKFIAARLADGATMLAALYSSAWAASAMTDKDVQDFVKYDAGDAARLGPGMANPDEKK